MKTNFKFKTILLGLAILLLGLGAISRAEGAVEEKLINPEDILAGFEEGTEKVKVIVNLAEPQGIKSTTDWNSIQSLQRLHSEVRALQAPILSMLSSDEFELQHRFENQAGFSGEVTLDGLSKLLNDPRVESIEPVYILKKYTKQGIPLINAYIYRQTYNGQGIAIAICDDGIDYTHSKLGGGGFPNSKVIGGYDFGDFDSDPFPNYNSAHGTSCAGIAAGDPNGPNENIGDYIGGVAYDAKLYALKVEDSSGIIYTPNVVAAWDWCITHKNDDPNHPILVISHSLGAGHFNSACDSSQTSSARAANDAVAAGITVLAASGNEGYFDSICMPACLSNVISVGAVYDAYIGNVVFEGGFSEYARVDKVPVYSNTANFLDILAPAHNAYTTDIVGSAGYTWGDYFTEFGDTSASCPYAAGAVACLQSATKALTGNYLSPSEVRDRLTLTGDDVTDVKADITKPRVNLGRAIDSLNQCDIIPIQTETGTSTWNYPMNPSYEDSRTQVIYLASEIGSSGSIKALALDFEECPKQLMPNWTIRMKHTSRSAYSTALLDNTGWSWVYQNDEYIYSTGWQTFEFQIPFEYNGTDNLLVDFSYSNSFPINNGLCRVSTPGGTRSAYAYSDSRHGDPLNWVGSTAPDVYGSDYVPNIKLTICPPRKDPVDFLTEEFTSSDPFDLEFTSVTFMPAGENSYIGSLQNITELPTNPSGGTDFGLRDDNCVRVRLSNQARVRIFNQSFSTIYVGSNGYITFRQGDTDASESLAEHFEMLRISGLYTDLTADYTGSVTGKQLSNRVVITWQGVPEWSDAASNTFQIEMFYDGRIRLSWLEIGSPSNIVGLSNGQGLPQDFEETDFSEQYAL